MSRSHGIRREKVSPGNIGVRRSVMVLNKAWVSGTFMLRLRAKYRGLHHFQDLVPEYVCT
jgi:hypothetical protein